MTEKELADQLRLRQHQYNSANKEYIDVLSDAQIIDSYITCHECGEKQVDKEDLRTAIRVAKDSENFLDICKGLAKAHYKREQRAKPPIHLSKKMQKRVNRIQKLINNAYYDEEKNPCIPEENEDELYGEIEEILDRNQEHILMEWAERLPIVQEDLLDAFVYDLGYSYEYWIVDKNTDEIVSSAVGLPFAFMIFIQLNGTKSNLPDNLPKTVKQMTEKRLLRKILNLNDDSDLGFDGTLYNADNEAWNEPSTVRNYLKNWYYYFVDKTMPLYFPIFVPNNKNLSFNAPKNKDSVLFMLRIMCGTIFMDSEDFEKCDIFEKELNGDALKEFEQLIKEEFSEKGLKVGTIDVAPLLFNLSEIVDSAEDIYNRIITRQEQVY